MSSTSSGVPAPTPVILCHGEILFDCIADQSAAGWTLDEVVGKKCWTPYPGGAPANVACALAKLGTKAQFIGAVGDDEQGATLLSVLKDAGVGMDLVESLPGKVTRTVMVTRSHEGERTFAGFGDGRQSHMFADCTFRASSVRDRLEGKVGASAWLVQGTLGLAYEGSAEAHRQLARWVEEGGGKRFVDINWRPVFWNYGHAQEWEHQARESILAFAGGADLLKLTDEEAEWLFEMPREEALRNPSGVRACFPRAKGVLVTAGEKGAAFDVLGHVGFVEPFGVPCVETTGAGDAFTAGLLHRLKDFDLDGPLTPERRAHIEEAVRFASAVGALTCCHDGAIAAQPTLAEVEHFLATNSVAPAA